MFGKTDDFRNELASALEAAIARVRELVGSADPAAFNRRPARDSWSAAECVDHLNASARLYSPVLAEAIQEARRQGLTGHRADGRTLLGRFVVWTTEPPPRLKTGTFAELEPSRDHDPPELAATFASLHRALIDQIRGAADLDGKRVKIRSVLDSRLKLSLHDWYAFIAAHARRHLWQAERALHNAGHGPGRRD